MHLHSISKFRGFLVSTHKNDVDLNIWHCLADTHDVTQWKTSVRFPNVSFSLCHPKYQRDLSYICACGNLSIKIFFSKIIWCPIDRWSRNSDYVDRHRLRKIRSLIYSTQCPWNIIDSLFPSLPSKLINTKINRDNRAFSWSIRLIYGSSIFNDFWYDESSLMILIIKNLNCKSTSNWPINKMYLHF